MCLRSPFPCCQPGSSVSSRGGHRSLPHNLPATWQLTSSNPARDSLSPQSCVTYGYGMDIPTPLPYFIDSKPNTGFTLKKMGGGVAYICCDSVLQLYCMCWPQYSEQAFYWSCWFIRTNSVELASCGVEERALGLMCFAITYLYGLWLVT